jgi:hypothetical protein
MLPYWKFRTCLDVTLYVRLMYCFDVVNNDSLKVCEIGPFVRHVLYWILLLSEVILDNEKEKGLICNSIHCVCIVIFFCRNRFVSPTKEYEDKGTH